jgi:PucR C-terminal helix-turn-helix domain/GGDEF-like domain
LLERREEIEGAISNRVFSLADPAEIGDPSYTAGLREAVSVAIDYALHAVLEPGGKEVPIPPTLFVQAREAARNGVSLDTVLRRYCAGYTLLGDFILQAAEESLSTEELQRICRVQATLFDRVLQAITEEYKRHADPRLPSVDQAKAGRVKALLAGELVESAELGYEIEGRWHIGAIAQGPDTRSALRDLAGELDSRLLIVEDDGFAWAWLGTERTPDTQVALQLASAGLRRHMVLAFGEAGKDFYGWRLTHRQAKAAITIAQRRPCKVVHYSEVALLCAAIGDEVLASSLRETYLRPLGGDHEDGTALRETLRAYFGAERNVSSAAAALGVNRNTVASRLQTAAERLGRKLNECSAELEVALQLEELDGLSPGTLPGRALPLQAY